MEIYPCSRHDCKGGVCVNPQRPEDHVRPEAVPGDITLQGSITVKDGIPAPCNEFYILQASVCHEFDRIADNERDILAVRINGNLHKNINTVAPGDLVI